MPQEVRFLLGNSAVSYPVAFLLCQCFY